MRKLSKIIALASVVIVIIAIVAEGYNTKAIHLDDENYNNVSGDMYGSPMITEAYAIDVIDVVGKSKTFEPKEFKGIIKSIPLVMQFERFQKLSKQRSKYITLTPYDMFLLHINMVATEEYKTGRIEAYEGKIVEISMFFRNVDEFGFTTGCKEP